MIDDNVGEFIASFYNVEDVRSSRIPRLRYKIWDMRYLFGIAYGTKDRIFIVNDYKEEYIDMLDRQDIKYCEINKEIYEFIYDCMVCNGIDEQSGSIIIEGIRFQRNLVGFN